MNAVSEAATARDWPAYFRAVRRLAEDAGDQDVVTQPPAEHTSRDPWPGEFDVPPVVLKLRTAAEAVGWEVRLGYSRAYLKQGRGYVRANGTGARWVLHELVQVAVRGAWIVYRQDVGVGTGWAFHGAAVNGTAANVTAWRAFINAGPAAYAGGQRDPRGGKND